MRRSQPAAGARGAPRAARPGATWSLVRSMRGVAEGPFGAGRLRRAAPRFPAAATVDTRARMARAAAIPHARPNPLQQPRGNQHGLPRRAAPDPPPPACPFLPSSPRAHRAPGRAPAAGEAAVVDALSRVSFMRAWEGTPLWCELMTGEVVMWEALVW